MSRQSIKDTALQRVILLCTVCIAAAGFLYWSGHHKETFDFRMVSFLCHHIWLSAYLCFMNIATFFLFGWDKWRAKRDGWRVPIRTLLGACFLGGSIGGYVGMHVFHHKTKKNYFTIGVPFIIVTQGIWLLYVMNWQ